MAEPSFDRSADPQTLEVDLRAGRAKLHARLGLSPVGVLAIASLVTGVLLASAAIVWTATSVARRHPIAARLGRR